MNDEWETQDDLYQVLNQEFGFQFDLCANEKNTKCAHWSEDVQDFAVCIGVRDYDVYWMNPPYSRKNINKCMAAATYMNGHGKTVVTLTRFDPTANWFKSCVDGIAQEVRMLDKRLRFKGAAASYPFPCCVSVYRGRKYNTEYIMWGWT